MPDSPIRKIWHKIRDYPKLSLLIIILVVSISIFLIISRLPAPMFPDDYSTVFTDRVGNILRIYLNDDEQWLFPPYSSKVPEKLETCILKYEDKRFHRHIGIDFLALSRAIWQNISQGEYVSGASTITMQVARLIGKRDRTIFNKIKEMSQAIRIELKFTKDEILKMYVQHAPYGGNIIGYEVASRRYFNKPSKNLTWSEAATLAILPNSPSLINPVSGRESLKKKRNWLLERLYDDGTINKETLELSKLEEIPDSQLPFDIHAPHLCDRVYRQKRGSIVQTSIDIEIQKEVNDICQDYSDFLQKFGIKNISAIVIDNQTGKVRAYIGSQDYFDINNAGMVDGVMGQRSYGSVLKPFLYALAIDEGLILPQTRLKDIPTYYGAFAPYNADKAYRGLVSAHDALIYSLNVPTVRLLYEYGYPKFYDFLQNAGISSLDNPSSHYGLTIILGGAEASLFELSQLYYGLAHFGEFADISFFEDDTVENRQKIISNGASYLIIENLKELKRPGAEHYWNLFSNQWPIAWKTGTSYGNRDAWAIGINPKWTVGVWAGNFSGIGNPAIRGAKTAGPALFRIFDILPKDPYNAWFKSDDNDFKEIELCPETGYAKGSNCPESASANAPISNEIKVKPLRKCPYHKKIFIAFNPENPQKKPLEQVCSRCWEPGHYKAVNWLSYPPSVVQFLKKHGHNYRSLPPHRKSCPVHHTENPLEFIYPTDDMVLLVPKGLEGDLQKVIAKAAHSIEDTEIYWYLDGSFIGATIEGSEIQTHTIAISLKKGKHRLSITDSYGNNRTIDFEARLRD
ncbi:MAG: penicillin-binding protein 1C [Candidatus Zixiibacteriota bacterium]